MAKHTITITLDGAEDDNLLNLADVRDAVAIAIAQDFGEWNDQHGYERDNGLVRAFSIDSRAYDPEKHRLEELPEHFTPEVIDYLMGNQKIKAIKAIRQNAIDAGLPMGLAEAKALVDNWKP